MPKLRVWDEKYAAKRPRRLLAFDGGGMLGVMSLEILLELERQLALRTGKGAAFRLGEYFDYIGGTSTGAIVAAGLSIGMTAQELMDFYVNEGPNIFTRAGILQRIRNGFDDVNLRNLLQKRMGTRALGADDLLCLLLVVTRNATTDSPWPISNNPAAVFNDEKLAYCNLNIPLWRLVRASTAAPTYFPPEVLQWDENDPSQAFTFVDGGTTPYNNPGFLLFRMATAPEYGLNWDRGEKNLALISVGTGSAPKVEEKVRDYGRIQIVDGLSLIGVLMGGVAVEQDINCRTVGRCVSGLPIDLELGDMIPKKGDPRTGERLSLSEDQGRAFLYARYDPDVSRNGLDALGLKDIKPDDVQNMERTDTIKQMQAVGAAFATEHVRISDFGGLLG